MATKLVLRPPEVPPNLRDKCEELCRITKYKCGNYHEHLAPTITDCLTAIAWLFHNNVEKQWKLYPIANMPTILLAQYNFKVAHDLRPGDLVFLSNAKGLTRHVVIGVPPKSKPDSTEETDEIFHCSSFNKGGKIESLTHVLSQQIRKHRMYCEINCLHRLILQLDPRIKPYETETMTDLARKVYASCLQKEPFFKTPFVQLRAFEENKDSGPFAILIPKPPLPGKLAHKSPTYIFKNGSNPDLTVYDREASPKAANAPQNSPRVLRRGSFQNLSIQESPPDRDDEDDKRVGS